MKNPNGYGSIVKLPGKRRNPYAVRVTTSIGLEDGQFRQKRKYVGYYPTKKEALHALEEYHHHPDMMLDHATFAEVYERWSDEHFPTISDSSVRFYRAAFRAVPQLHERQFADLKPVDLQAAVDTCGKGYATRRNIVTLYSQLYQFASFHRIIPSDVNPAHLLNVGKREKPSAHHRFNEQEVAILWEHSDDPEVQIILMMIYTGVRPGEFFDLRSGDVHPERQFFYIRHGKNTNAVRAVPIAQKLVPFFQNWKDQETEYLITYDRRKVDFQRYHQDYAKNHWTPTLSALGILHAVDTVTGEAYVHKPHDCRHTFASMWADRRLDEKMRRKIQGHAGKGVGEQVYTHVEISRMIEEVNKLFL